MKKLNHTQKLACLKKLTKAMYPQLDYDDEHTNENIRVDIACPHTNFEVYTEYTGGDVFSEPIYKDEAYGIYKNTDYGPSSTAPRTKEILGAMSLGDYLKAHQFILDGIHAHVYDDTTKSNDPYYYVDYEEEPVQIVDDFNDDSFAEAVMNLSSIDHIIFMDYLRNSIKKYQKPHKK